MTQPWNSQPDPAPEDEAWRNAPPPGQGSSQSYGQAQYGQDSYGQSSYGHTQPSQNPYAQTEYGHGNYGQDQPSATPWDQPHSASSANNPYLPTGTDPYTGYPAATQPYGVPGGVVDDPSSKKGVVALSLSAAALAISLVLSWLCASGYGELFEVSGTTNFDTIEVDTMPPGASNALAKAMVGLFGQLIPTGLGIAGFVVAIMAMKLPSQKTLGVLGLITAIVAPFISFVVFMVLFMQNMPTA